MTVPRSHPRFKSLVIREKLVSGFEHGLVAREGLLAHGRGEAFDYLLGESTGISAKRSLRAAAASMLLAEDPVISVNGNAAALCPREIIRLASIVDAKLEVNLFYADEKRQKNIAKALMNNGAKHILGIDSKSSKQLSEIDSARRTVDKDGIFSADLVLVPLEDGDRTGALKKAGKKTITIDLNPLSRTAQTADISIIDNITRGMAELASLSSKYSAKSKTELLQIVREFDNKDNLTSSIQEIRSNLDRRLKIA